MEENRVTIKQTNIFFIIFMLGYVGVSLLVGMFIPINTPYWLTLCINHLIIVLPVIVIILVKKLEVKKLVMLERIGLFDIVQTYIGAYCLLPLIYLINYCSSFFAKNHVNDIVADIEVYPLWAQLVLLALLPALAEEFVFRGFFYGHFRKYNIIKAMLMSGLFFGIAHLNINQFAYAFVIGVAFCLLYEASGSIVLPMTAHFAINANTVFMMRLVNGIDENALKEAAEISEAAQVSMIEVVITILVMIVLSVFFTALFGYIVSKIAGRNKRTESLLLKSSKLNENGEQERFVDVYWVLGVIPMFAYMLMLEMI